MRLLVVTNDFPPTLGGIENYIYALVSRWPPEQLTVVARSVPGDAEFDARQPFETIRLPAKRILFPDRRTTDSVRRVADDREIEFVHFPAVLPLALMGRRLERPYAVTIHGGEFVLARRLPLMRSALRRACRSAAVILPECSFAEAHVVDFTGGSVPVTRVTCGVDAGRYGRGNVTPVGDFDGKRVVISVSRLIARKGPRVLVQAFPAVLDRHPDAHLVIAGGGPDLELLKSRVADAGIAESVTLVGPQSPEAIPRFLAAAEIFAMPTRSRFAGLETEGLPIAFVEAAASGLPLIGSDTGGVRDAVRHGETGLLVDPRSSDSVARGITELLDDPERASALGKAGRAMVESEFDPELIFGTYVEALKGCLN